MAIKQFPRDHQTLVQLPPPPGPEGLCSWRVAFPPTVVPVLGDPTAAAADENGYFPIAAVFLAAPGCVPRGCTDITVFINDGMSRFSAWATQFRSTDATPPHNVNVVIEWAIKQGVAGVSTQVATATSTITFTPGKGEPLAEQSGLIIGVDGVLCTQYELWGRVSTILGVPAGIEVRVQLIVDRLTGGLVQFPGPGAMGGGTPLPRA